MKLTRLSFVCIMAILLTAPGKGYSQNSNTKLSLNEGTIENQFNYVIQKSNKFEDYKMVKSWQLYRLKTHVLDSMKSEKTKLIESKEVIVLKNKEIESLQTNLESTNEKLSQAIGEKDSMLLLGRSMNKAAYNSIMWTLIAGLAALLILYLILHRRSNAITFQTKKSLSELKGEYEDYRKRSLAREQKTVRKLYDEILKYKSKAGKV